MQIFRYQKEETKIDKIKKEILNSWEFEEADLKNSWPTEMSTGPNCIK